jgi:hypothetical protein
LNESIDAPYIEKVSTGKGSRTGGGMVVLVLAVLVASAGCASKQAFQDPFTRTQIDWNPAVTLGVAEAERILGNNSRVEKVTTYVAEGTKAYQSAFRDDWLYPSTGKMGILYYMYEEYQNAEAARSFLYSTLKANHIRPEEDDRKGAMELYYMAGGEVVRMVMILHEDRLLRLKVNQVTSHYSLVEFKKVAEELASQL